ncbi:hypothetical protein E1176_14255 [Fulvivirga sp. RKSG066]|uniref:hypothetical protein n=1 Tax=Fulvivirga aurantia TaxID=2529383 RepID=UPI0012BC3C31|nr:hypothetical protein [Fulvivirga aurantia]MTI22190.1 hypothetical protein [Fulvivirga aurantia]
MVQILLCVLMNVGIFVCFRMFGVLKLNTLQAIVFNYITCVVTGLIFIGDMQLVSSVSTSDTWIYIAMGLGGIFIGTFYLMAITTQKFSITVSSIATKMSLVIPVLFSLLVLGIQSKDYTFFNYSGMFLAVVAILLSSYKEKKIKTEAISGFELALPILIFVLGGIIDSSINYTNHVFLSTKEEAIFPVFVFASASVIGIIILMVQKQTIKLGNVLGGVTLGVVNYFSIYFLITSLSAFENDGAMVYPLMNVGIIIFGAIVSVIFFKEKISKLNFAGLVLALISIILISYQELSNL